MCDEGGESTEGFNDGGGGMMVLMAIVANDYGRHCGGEKADSIMVLMRMDVLVRV